MHHSVLRVCYAKSGTEIAYAATRCCDAARSVPAYASTDLTYAASFLSATSSTAMTYDAIFLRNVRYQPTSACYASTTLQRSPIWYLKLPTATRVCDTLVPRAAQCPRTPLSSYAMSSTDVVYGATRCPYAMCGTGVAYGAMRYASTGTELAYGAMRSPVRDPAIGLRSCYAMSGTYIAYCAICLRSCYAMSGTYIACGDSILCADYARSGTDLAYDALCLGSLGGTNIEYRYATRCAVLS
eukprot:265045-Rhodomonas_salina.3